MTSDRPAFFRAKADRSRRLADSGLAEFSAVTLHALADYYERRAAQAEARAVEPNPAKAPRNDESSSQRVRGG